jgi:hypothetical protein
MDSDYLLIQRIVDLSESTSWESAKQEWAVEYIYWCEEPEECLCGHFPINNICIIRNSKNGKTVQIGSCCVKKFLPFEKEDRIFQSIKKLKNDISKSMNLDALDYLLEKKRISQQSYKFYHDIYRKRKLSPKQKDYKESINRSFLAITRHKINNE